MRVRRFAALMALGLTIVATATVAQAAFHVMKVREVFAGTGSNANAQYVVLQMYAGGQNQVQTHEVFVYNSLGVAVGTFVFPTAVANGANQDTIYLATDAAVSLFGISRDLAMTPVIDRAGGKVCFESPGIDCVSWGSYSGTEPEGTPFNASEGLIASASILRTQDSTNSANDFTFAEPRPINNARATGSCGCGFAGFDAAAYSRAENAGPLIVSVTRTSTTGTESISYATVDGTATSPADYTAESGTLSFPDGTATQTFDIDIVNDAVIDGGETFKLRLRGPQSTMLSKADVIVTIVQAASPPSVPLNPAASAGTGQISLNWSPPASNGGSPVTGYIVYAGNASGTLSPLPAIGNVTTFTETGLGNNVARFYAIAAVNAAGTSPQSSEVSATTLVVATAPRSLTFSSTLTSITLNWLAPLNDGGSAVTGYNVYHGTTPSSLTLLATSAATTFTHSGLPSGVVRYYRVTAVNGNGEGATTLVLTASTGNPPQPPTAPTVSNATGGPGAGQITITWTASGMVTSFNVYRATAAGGTPVLLASGISGGARSFIDGGLGDGTTRAYRVSALNAAGESVLSNERSATTFVVPSAPQLPRTNPGGGVGQIRVFWNPPSSDGGAMVTQYRVYRKAAGGAETLVATTGNLSVTDSGLQPLVSYTYRITALNVVGEGAFSAGTCMKPYPWVTQLGCIV